MSSTTTQARSRTAPATRQELKDRYSSSQPGIAKAGQNSIKSVSVKQWLWFAGQVLTVLGCLFCMGSRLVFAFHSFWPSVVYRLTLVVIIGTYYLSLRQSLNGELPGFWALLPLETFQYLLLACLWLVTPAHTNKILPFLLYAFMHAVDFFSQYMSRNGAIGRTLGNFVNKNSYRAARLIGYVNFFILIQLIYDSVLMRPGAIFSLVGYAIFYRIRLMYTELAQQTVKEVYAFVDKELSNPKRPEKIRNIWAEVKDRIENNGSRGSQYMREEEERAIQEANAQG